MRRYAYLFLIAAVVLPAAIAAQVPSRAFVKATIQSITGKTIYALSWDRQPLTLHLSPTCDIWKGQHGLDVSVLKPGDFIFANGSWNSDGSIDVKDLYANIVNYFGWVISVKGEQFEIIAWRNTKPIKAVLSANNPKTLIDNGKGSLKDLLVGTAVQMVGLQKDDGTVLATSIRVYADQRRRSESNSR